MKKISNKISIVIILCSFVAIVVLGGIGIVESSKLVRSDAEDKLTWMARQYAAQFSNDLNLIENNVQEMEVYFKDTFDVQQLEENPNYLAQYEEQLAEYIFNFASKRSNGIAAWCYFNPELSETPHDVYYVDGDGDKIPDRQNYIPFSYYDETPTPTDDKQWWYGPIETKAGFWTNPYEWTLINHEVIKVVSYARPIFINNELIAVIGTYYHFDDMFKKITDIQVYERGYATLYNEKLDIIIHPNHQSGTRYTSDNLSTIENGKYAELSSEILHKDYGIMSYEENKKEQYMAYSRLSNGWILGINPVASEIFSGIYGLIYKLLLAVAGCMIASVIVAYFTGIKMTKPLRKVVQCAQQIGTGNLDVHVEVNTQDEMKMVADSLNEMVHNTKQLQGELKRFAYYDDLTEMANKNLFRITARDLISKGKWQYAYVILDISKFKVINDIFGYAYGDSLLKHIARILLEDLSEEEVAARYAGDIFHILCQFTSKSALQARLAALETKISEFTFVSNTNYRISMCFGVYVIESVNFLIEAMGDKAGFAVKKIKDTYSTSIYFYNDDIRNRILEEQEIENGMQTGIENEEFKVYIQPKYSLKTLQIEGGEALVRWDHPQKGIISPEVFISIFEKNGFITQLDMYMLDNVCKKLRSWIDSGRVPVVISVNQSRLHLHNPNYLNTITEILKRHNIPSKWIELEITESAFFEDTEKMIGILNKLHELGFKISMDDFGSGYSSLNMLHEITVDVLKIDKKFFNDRSNSERGKKIVDNIISMARDLNIVVVAEGVETKEQVDFLMKTDCYLVQGYYFAKPMPVEEFEKHIPYLLNK